MNLAPVTAPPGFAVASPHAAAREWLFALERGEDARAWKLLDRAFRVDECRRCLSEALRGACSDEADQVDAIARDVADAHPADPMWGSLVRAWLNGRRHEVAETDRTGWSWSTKPRPVAVGFELVVWARPVTVLYGPTALTPATQFLMRETPDGWRVAGFDERLPGG